MREAIDGVKRTSIKDKHTAYSKILYQVATKKISFNYEQEAVFMSYINELSPQHISLLCYFTLEVAKDETTFAHIETYQNLYDKFQVHIGQSVDKYLFKKWCVDLETKALINYGGELTDFNNIVQMQVTEQSQGNSLIITPLGYRFGDYVSHFGSKQHFKR